MKYPLFFLLSSIVGILLGMMLGISDTLQALMAEVAEVIINLGRYLLFLLILTSGGHAVSKLVQQGLLKRVVLRSFAILGIMWAVFIPLGFLIGGFAVPERIPPTLQEATPLQVDSFLSHIEKIFPSNVFMVFSHQGRWLLPLVVFAAVIGCLSVLELRRGTRHIMNLLEAMSDSVWYLVKIATIGISTIVGGLAAYTVISTRSVDDILIFIPLLIVLGITAFLFVFLIFPMVLSLFIKKNTIGQWYRAIRIPVFAALWSGDVFFPFAFLQRAAVEEKSISSSVSITTLTISTLFGRVGTMMVAATGFMVILRSYSALELTFPQLLSIVGAMAMYAFSLHALPSTGVTVLLALLSAWYLKGAGETYLILFPVFFLLQRLAVIIDVASAMFVSLLTKIPETAGTEFSRMQLRHQMLMEDLH